MNLLQAISLSELKAGGPGSGCHGDNCGRPAGASKYAPNGDKKLWEKQQAPERLGIQYPMKDPAAERAQLEHEALTHQSALALQQKYGSTAQAKTADGTNVKEGDTVKLLKPVTVWNMKTGNNDTYPPGTKATVLHVLPKIGNADQIISVQVKRNHEAEYVKANDVKLYKATGPTTVETEPVQKSRIKQQFTSNDGAQVTIVKSPQTRDSDPRTIQDLASQASRYKGQFSQIEKVSGADGQTTRVYDTSNIPSRAWRNEGGSAPAKSGVTVWVHHYDDHVTVQEQSYLRWGQKAKGMITWTYDKPQKFLLQSVGMLKKRYGISIPSKETF